jgi:hypothetical protein
MTSIGCEAFWVYRPQTEKLKKLDFLDMRFRIVLYFFLLRFDVLFDSVARQMRAGFCRKEDRKVMEKRMLSVIMVVLFGVLFLTVSILTAADAPKVPEEVKIENQGYTKDKKGHVKFSHNKHVTDYKAVCAECHHEYNDKGENTWKEGAPVKKCVECHDIKAKKGKVMKLQNAYHRNCKNCHKAYVKDHAESKAPYKKCTQCHQKKS